jgi:hypothetical protein
MLQTNKINDYLYEATDGFYSVLFWLTSENIWEVQLDVIDGADSNFVRLEMDSYDDAQGTAYEFLSKVYA